MDEPDDSEMIGMTTNEVKKYNAVEEINGTVLGSEVRKRREKQDSQDSSNGFASRQDSKERRDSLPALARQDSRGKEDMRRDEGAIKKTVPKQMSMEPGELGGGSEERPTPQVSASTLASYTRAGVRHFYPNLFF